jgi:hypothetical protein
VRIGASCGCVGPVRGRIPVAVGRGKSAGIGLLGRTEADWSGGRFRARGRPTPQLLRIANAVIRDGRAWDPKMAAAA